MARAKSTQGKNKRSVAKKPQKGQPQQKGRRKTRGPKHSWPQLRDEYIRATKQDGRELSLEEFALEKKIAPSVLRAQAAKEKWLEQRRRYHDHILALRREKAAEKMATQGAEQDVKDFAFATGIINLGDRKVKSLETPGKEIKASDLDRLASAGERAQRVHRIAAGRSLPSEGGQQVNVNVLQGNVDPMERIRRKFAACKDAGMDVEETVQGFCQMVAQDLLGPEYVVELKRLKVIKGK